MQSIGKKVFKDHYFHISVFDQVVDLSLKQSIAAAIARLPADSRALVNVIKSSSDKLSISLLQYEDFESSPFPALKRSWVVDPSGKVKFRSFQESLNPPILHRKELLVSRDNPNYEAWSVLTQTAEDIGLFNDSRTIGFKKNWEDKIRSSGFELVSDKFLPIGNNQSEETYESETGSRKIQRHLTALHRNSLSAPVQLLLKNGLLSSETTFFDYGCGRGTDIAALLGAGVSASGWDPHFAEKNPIFSADIVNLGFVINVIEDPAERVEAITKAFEITGQVLSVAAMLYGPDRAGKPFGDGFLTARNTFQKYFTQGELKDFLEHVLHQQVYMVGPGVAFIFADKSLEQKFNSQRFRSDELTRRLMQARLTSPMRIKEKRLSNLRVSRAEEQFLSAKNSLDRLWSLALDLGRMPDALEVLFLSDLLSAVGSYSRATRLLKSHYDQSALAIASSKRADELLLYLISLQFEKRPPYKTLETRIQKDVKYFFGDYKSAQQEAVRLLLKTGNRAEIFEACKEAATNGLGWLDGDHSLHFQYELLERLPVLLRAFVNCGLLLWKSSSAVHIIKLHIGSGKLTLLEYQNFYESPLPELRKRVKINLRTQTIDVFEYGSEEYPSTVLIEKSRFMHEDLRGYVEQYSFDELLTEAQIQHSDLNLKTTKDLAHALNSKRLEIDGFSIIPSTATPDLDDLCGANFRYRDLVECGETFEKLRPLNSPKNPETFNAIHHLAVEVLDPVVDYFGAIRLTFGFCSAALSAKIAGRIAPKLDQHAGHECDKLGHLICDRGGFAADFIVEDEDMLEVAQWIAKNTNFDRLYFYGRDKPVHVSAARSPNRQITLMLPNPRSGKRTPKTITVDKFSVI
jgi:DNA phosphorothioation-associated putative methyltransferase